jgi:6-phosphogluconolactonase
MMQRILLLSLFLFALRPDLSGGETNVYFGTYTKGGDSKGIYRATFDADSGKPGKPALAAEVENPSFLTIDPSGKFLYAVSEIGSGSSGGVVTAFRIGEKGALEKINSVDSGGAGPCYVSTSSDGGLLAVANYGSGSVASYLLAEDGAISVPVSVEQHTGSSINPKRQKEPHAHSIRFSPDDRFVYSADLGTDRIYRYAIDAKTGALTASGETLIQPGFGPRHFTFLPGGKYAYVINELSLMMTAFRVNPESGDLKEILSLSTLPEGTDPIGSTAEVVAHPSGRFLYGSNRGHNTIVMYSVNPDDGTLTYLGNEPTRGKTPRNFTVSPDGKWLLAAGQDSGNVTVFSIDESTGKLTFTGDEIQMDRPVCIRFQP